MNTYYKQPKQRNITQIVHRGKANRIAHILRRNCLLKHSTEIKIEAKIELMEKRHKQLLDNPKERILNIERRTIRSHSVENSL
jgi:hypothetical protein